MDAALRTSAERQVERKRYAAALAERQFNRVDPDNRLVADELERAMNEVGVRGTVLLVFSPVYVKHLPVRGSKADIRLTACKGPAAAVARSASHASLLDLYVELPGTEDRANFGDSTHWTSTLAAEIDAAIAQRLNALLN
jgi:hypothetical protein